MMRFRRGGSANRSDDSASRQEQAPLNADFASSTYSPRGVASSPPSYDFGRNQRSKPARLRPQMDVNHPPFVDEEDRRREYIDRQQKRKDRRSSSVGRPASSNGWKDGRKPTVGRRTTSTGRAVSRQLSRRQMVDANNSNNVNNYYDPTVPKYVNRHLDASTSDVSQPELMLDAMESNDYSDDNSPGIKEAGNIEEKKKKSKMEKIRSLQTKNELYKAEFKRVQKDRKRLKKELETKTVEVDNLTKEIDTYISETSALKSKLSESLQRLDRTDKDGRKISLEVSQLSSELQDSQSQLKSAHDRIAKLEEQLAGMQESIHRKDDQINSLTREISQETHQIEMIRNENSMMRKLHEREMEKEGRKQQELTTENEKLQAELGGTLERAAAMVKEREDAIADLLRENDEMKRMLTAAQGETQGNAVSEEEVYALREKLSANAVALEEAEDRIVMLEEDVEAWIRRGHEMEAEIVELREEANTWQEKAMAAQESKEFVTKDTIAKETDAQSAQKALQEMKARYEAQFVEMEIKLRAAQMAAKEKEESSVGSRSGSPVASCNSSTGGQDAQDVQAMSLEMIVARKKKQKEEAAKRAGWGLFGKSEPLEELDENQKRIKELKKLNEEQEIEMKKIKSELVRLRSTYNEESYVNKKKVERLESENQAYEKRVAELERELHSGSAQIPDVSSPSGDVSTNSSPS